jgi:hypothetical protein
MPPLIPAIHEVLIMNVSDAPALTATTNQTQNTTVAIEVQKKTQDIEQQQASQLISSLPDPDSSLGHNIDIKV